MKGDTPAPDAWAEAAGVKIADALADAVSSSEGPVSLALSGGSTPRPVYRWLAEAGGACRHSAREGPPHGGRAEGPRRRGRRV